MTEVTWDEDVRTLMQAARRISGDLGHHEIVAPLHLLLGLLVDSRPASFPFAQPDRKAVKDAMAEFAPPWGDVGMFSPGGQTPTTKRVILRVMESAGQSGGPVGVDAFWAALNEFEPKLVGDVLARLGLERRDAR